MGAGEPNDIFATHHHIQKRRNHIIHKAQPIFSKVQALFKSLKVKYTLLGIIIKRSIRLNL
jgi:hypothetical protein